jgi:O-antigen ligase
VTRTRRTCIVAAGVAAIVTASNASEGGYFSQSWGWIALAFLVPATLVLILDGATAPGRLRIAFAGLMSAFAVWIALSSLWSISSSASVREVERVLVFVALALAVALVLRRGDTAAVLAGVAVGMTFVCSYALAMRLFPDRFDTYDDPIISYRLAEPLGYWNALGLLAALGLVVALGFVAHARRRATSAAVAAVVPLFATTLYFTFSRGAWAALAVGLLGTIAVDPRRLRLVWCGLVVAPPAMLCVAYASRQDALTTEDAPAIAAAREGHRVAAVVLTAAAASAFLALGARVAAERMRTTRRSRRAFDLALGALAITAVVGGLVAVGGPGAGVDKLERRFNAAPATAVNLNDRIFSISGNGRSELLRVSWDAARERPLVGQGAGTFEYLWYDRRPSLLVVRDGHSLYLETLAELGIIGLALLGASMLVVLIGAIRARRTRYVASGAGAFIAWAAASALDWHWEMVGVTLTALLAAAGGMLASEHYRPRALLSGTRLALVGVTAPLTVFGVVSVVGNQALFAGREAVVDEEWSEARNDARRARALLPWSYEPDIVLGDAAAGAGDQAGALRAYRDAVAENPGNWVVWLRLAQVARGSERETAYDRVHHLNPLEEGLPGERASETD